MTTRREKLLRLCEFDEDASAKANNWLCCITASPSELKGIVKKAAYSENTRLTPILTALIDENEKLRGALSGLEKEGHLKCNQTFHRLGGIDDCEPCKATEALTIPSPLDAFLSEGE